VSDVQSDLLSVNVELDPKDPYTLTGSVLNLSHLCLRIHIAAYLSDSLFISVQCYMYTVSQKVLIIRFESYFWVKFLYIHSVHNRSFQKRCSQQSFCFRTEESKL